MIGFRGESSDERDEGDGRSNRSGAGVADFR
jgi:hypothetical protein